MKHRSLRRFILEGVESILVSFVVLATWPVSKRWLRNWRALPEERERVWPGDRFALPHHRTYTRAIDIAASSSEVWLWLIQFGLGRAGFYSYELLERMVGIPVRNVESIVPDLQALSIGDEVLLHPKAAGIPIVALETGKHVCFGFSNELDPSAEKPDPGRSWSMYVKPRSGTACRLLLRGCIEPLRRPTFSKRMATLLEEPIDFIMEQRMLRTIRRLAESTSARGTDTAVAS